MSERKPQFYFIILASLMIPLETLAVPLFISLKNYGLLNNHFGVILPYAAIGIPFSTLVLTEFFKEIPVELRDAARIDGCSDFRYLYLVQIVMPLSGPAVSGVMIFQGSIIWNEFIIALTILQASSLYTIPLEVATFSRRYYTEWPLVFSTLSTSMVPVMLLYILFQRSCVKRMTLGAIKG
ncbi:MAG: carbohydrate ABC transporter permease [Atribacterota bacterium]